MKRNTNVYFLGRHFMASNKKCKLNTCLYVWLDFPNLKPLLRFKIKEA